jgi:aminodeoxyfutalosine synthase
LDRPLHDIAAKVRDGQRLSADDGLTLLRTRDIWTLGELANEVRERLHGKAAYYNINQHLNYTNLCALSCKFCAFYRKKDDPRGGVYEQPVEQIAAEAKKAAAAGATEMHIVGGLHPYLPFSYYTDMLRAIRAAAPKLHV